MHQLETLLEATVDKTFDRFEIYTLRNILTVPEELEPWIRLGHYEVRLDCCHRRYETYPGTQRPPQSPLPATTACN